MTIKLDKRFSYKNFTHFAIPFQLFNTDYQTGSKWLKSYIIFPKVCKVLLPLGFVCKIVRLNHGYIHTVTHKFEIYVHDQKTWIH